MTRVLRAGGRVVVLSLQVLAGVLSSLGSHGATGPGPMPTATTKRPDEYRP